MKIRTLVSRFVAAFMIACAVLGFLSENAWSNGADVIIGFTPALSGAHILEGQPQVRTVEMAVKAVNDAGGIFGRKLKVVTFDNHSNELGMVQAFENLFADPAAQPVAVISTVKSFQIAAIHEASLKRKVPVMMAGSSPSLTEKNNPWMFRVRPNEKIAARALIQYAKESMKAKKIGLLHENDTFGNEAASLVERYAKLEHVTIVKKLSYEVRERDFTKFLLQMKEAGVDLLIVYGTNGSDVGILQRQYADMGRPFPYLGSSSSARKATLKISQKAADGIIAALDFVPNDRPAAKTYVDTYKKLYGDEPDSIAIWTYDSVMLIANALKKAGPSASSEKLRDTLRAESYEGVYGTYKFDARGDGLSESTLVKIENGTPQALKVLRVTPE